MFLVTNILELQNTALIGDSLGYQGHLRRGLREIAASNWSLSP
jgi:hypothetical protein